MNFIGKKTNSTIQKKDAKGKVEKSYKNMKILGVRKREVKSNGQFLNQKRCVKSTSLWLHKQKTETENFVCMKTNVELPKLGKLNKKLEKSTKYKDYWLDNRRSSKRGF